MDSKTPQAVRASAHRDKGILLTGQMTQQMDDSLRCQTQLASRSPNGTVLVERSPLIPTRDAN